jgi:hypothetical protein
MVNFSPIEPNFYGRTAQKSTSGLQSIQGGSNQYLIDATQASRSRNTPGVTGISSGVNSSAQAVPPLFLNATSTSNIQNTTSLTSSPVVYASASVSIGIGTNPSLNRLAISGLPQAGIFTTGIDNTVNAPGPSFDQYAAFVDAVEDRVIISDQTGKFIGSISDFRPLLETGGVLFPYTPVITMGHKAHYEMENLLQTNYTTPYYTHSNTDGIGIQARFTAQNPTEAAYILAMMTFFRTATKMFYGASQNKGTPPPILFLDGYGQNILDHIPVVVTDFSYNLPNDVNYITTTEYGGRHNKVPVDLNVTLNLLPTYSRNKLSKFNLTEFANGGALTGQYQMNQKKSGGWI